MQICLFLAVNLLEQGVLDFLEFGCCLLHQSYSICSPLSLLPSMPISGYLDPFFGSSFFEIVNVMWLMLNADWL